MPINTRLLEVIAMFVIKNDAIDLSLLLYLLRSWSDTFTRGRYRYRQVV